MRKLLAAATVVFVAMIGTPEGAVSAAAAELQLADCGKLPYNMQMHGTAILGDRIYVFGGDLDGGAKTTLWTKKVQSAPLDLTSCKVGTWREEQPLPDMRSYMNNCVEVVNDRIYIVGGNVAQNATVELSAQKTNTVAWTRRNADGLLETWKLSAPYPGEPVMLGASCSNDKYLMLVGGLGKVAVDKIFVAEFAADGEPSGWKSAGTLPVPLFNHGACIQGNNVYVWGGRTANGVNRDAWSADLKDDGTLGSWSPENGIASGISGAAYCGINDYLVAVGGFKSAGEGSSDIWFARLQDKHVGQWQQLSTNLRTRVYHAIGVQKDKGWVLVTGGQDKAQDTGDNGRILDVVQAFQIPKSSSTDIARGMSRVGDVMAQARSTGKNALLFFYSPAVPACQRVWQEGINKPSFATLAGTTLIGAGNTADKDDSAWAYKLGVYRVPSLVEVSPGGDILRSSGALTSAEDVEAFLKSR